MLTSIKPKYDGDLSRVVILVDYSNLLYRSYFSSITSLQERPWLPILRFLDSLRLCVQRSKIDGTPLEIVFAGESKTPLIRSELDPTYKAQRSHLTDSAFQQVRGNIEKIVSDLGFEILNRDGYEADDIIASFVKKSCHQCRCKVRCANCEHKSEYDTDIVVYSNDRDMNQLLSFDVAIFIGTPEFIQESSIQEKTLKKILDSLLSNLTDTKQWLAINQITLKVLTDLGLSLQKSMFWKIKPPSTYHMQKHWSLFSCFMRLKIFLIMEQISQT